MKTLLMATLVLSSLSAHASAAAQPGTFRSTKLDAKFFGRSVAAFEIQTGKSSLVLARSTGLDSELQEALPRTYPQRPSIFITSGEQKQQVDLGPEFQGYAWVHAAAASNAKQFVGVLDWEIAEPGPELLFVKSGDGGKTWQLSKPLVKPNHMCQFRTLAMDLQGQGEVGIECLDTHEKAGLYFSSTTDGGKNWSAYRYVKSDFSSATATPVSP